MKQREKSVSPKSDTHGHNLNPVEGEFGAIADGGKSEDGEDVAQLDKYEEFAKKYEKFIVHVEQYFDDEQSEAKNVPVFTTPEEPTKEQLEKHQATHIPYVSWCKHCFTARAIRYHHTIGGRKPMVVPDIETGVNGPTKFSIDYMYLHERIGQLKNMEHNPRPLIMIDHNRGRVWTYRVPNKGVLEGVAWLPKRVVLDMNNCGHEANTIQLKSDQEPAIVILQTAIQELKPNIIPITSFVGEFESNGRVENAIRRVQERVRVFRHQVEQNIKHQIKDEVPIMVWMIRWAAEFISKCSPGDDGRTPYGRIRNEQCKVPVVPFGEIVMYLPLGTASGSTGEPTRRIGIWFGTIERTEESFVGITSWVIKCRIVSRLTEEDRWSKELVLNMQGVPWEPAPSRQGQHIPVEIKETGEVLNEEEENEVPRQ